MQKRHLRQCCATQLDGLVMGEVNGKLATRDVHIYGANPMWSKNLCFWRTAGGVTTGIDSKTGDRGTNMMLVGYMEQENNSARMWDPNTNRVVVTSNVIWLKHILLHQKGAAGVLEIKDAS